MPQSIDAEQMLQQELEPDERLVWVGQGYAVQGALMQARPILAGVVFIIGALAYSINQSLNSGPSIALEKPGWQGATVQRLQSVFGSAQLGILLALGALVIGAVVLLYYRRNTQTCYGITDRRLVILTVNGGARKIESHGPRDIQFVERRQRQENVGDVIFARYAGNDGKGATKIGVMGVTALSYNDEMGFFGIPDAAVVESLVRQLKEGTVGQSLSAAPDPG